YSFLKKLRFGRKGRVYRILGEQYESNPTERDFAEIFKFERAGAKMADCKLNCLFLKNPEAASWDLSKLSVESLQKKIAFNFIPPALKRRSDETGISPEDYVLQAFFKGKIYSSILKASRETNNHSLLEIDFVLKCNSAANKLLKEKEKESGSIDYGEVEPEWQKRFKDILKEESANAASAPTQPAEVEEEAEAVKGVKDSKLKKK
ncbi:MAG: hypothetical protein ABIH99_05410, partial [Candidatus Micrarchaeota archaeon]